MTIQQVSARTFKNAVIYRLSCEDTIRLDTTPDQVFLSEGQAKQWMVANNVRDAKWQGYTTLHLPNMQYVSD